MEKFEKLSSEYWGLHRNSLLLSSALFLACLITDASKFKVFELEFGALGAGAVTLMLLCASTYCIVALYFEWKDEALSLYNKKSGRLANLDDKMEEASKILNESSGKIFEVYNALYHTLSEFNGNHEILGSDSVYAALNGKFSDVLTEWEGHYNHDIANVHGSDAKAYLSDVRDRVLRVGSAVQAAQVATLEGIVRQGHRSAMDSLKSVGESCLTFSQIQNEKIENLISNKEKIRDRISKEKVILWMRLCGFGIFLPSIIYAIGFAHAVGRLWYPIFCSPLIPILHSVH